MRAVNLLPREALVLERPKVGAWVPLLGASLVPIVAAGLLATGYSSATGLVTSRTNELANLVAAIPKTTTPSKATPAEASPQLTILNASIGDRQSALDAARANEVPWDTTLDQIARLVPPGVWLTQLDGTTPAAPVAPPVTATTTTTTSTTTTTATPPPAPAPVTTGFTIAGDAETEQGVATLLERLQLLPALTNVALTSTGSTTIGTKAVVSFNITAGVQTASGAGT